jgi:hypothetical protein
MRHPRSLSDKILGGRHLQGTVVFVRSAP